MGWAVPDTAQLGDTVTLDLPPELHSPSTTFNPINPAAQVIAVASVLDGNAVCTSQSEMADRTNVAGEAHCLLELSRTAVPGNTFILTWGSKAAGITVVPPTTVEPNRYGEGQKLVRAAASSLCQHHRG